MEINAEQLLAIVVDQATQIVELRQDIRVLGGQLVETRSQLAAAHAHPTEATIDVDGPASSG